MLANTEATIHFVTNGSGSETNAIHADGSYAPYTSALDRLELLDTLGSRINGNPTVKAIYVHVPIEIYPIKDDSLDLGLDAIKRDITSLRQGRPEGVRHFISFISFALWEQFQEKVLHPSTVASLIGESGATLPFANLVFEVINQVYDCSNELNRFKQWVHSKVAFCSIEASSIAVHALNQSHGMANALPSHALHATA
jgi:hypothetical protein